MQWRISIFRCPMKVYIYIAGSFETVNRSSCGQKGSWVDNDPHFWSDPPTWGICRNDLRGTANSDDVVFFVLPRHGRHPQMIFGYLTIDHIITHHQAFHTPGLVSKRMSNKIPNGNIIVNATGGYNRFDEEIHHQRFDKIKLHYAVGKPRQSRLLTDREIRRLAPTFTTTLVRVLGKSGLRPIDVISRKGAILTTAQVNQLLNWLNQPQSSNHA